MSATDTTRTRVRTNRSAQMVLGSFLAGVPALWWGYGTDIDTANVLRAGRSFFDGDYQLSRPPGNFPYELAAYVLAAVGGAPGPRVGRATREAGCRGVGDRTRP